MRSLVALVALLVLVPLVPVAPAFHRGEELPAHVGRIDGNGWVSFKVETDGAEIDVRLFVDKRAGPGHLGMFAYAENETFEGGLTYTSLPGQSGVFLSAGLPGEARLLHEDELDRGNGPSGGGVLMAMNDPRSPVVRTGVFKLLLWVAGDVNGGDWELRLEDGARLLATESGDDAFLATSTDFESVAAAHAYVDGFGARGDVGARVTTTAERHLVGIFATVLTSANALAMQTGDGGVRPCADLVSNALPNCFFPHVTGPAALPTGTTTFHATGAGGSISGLAEFYVSFADARLPA